MKRATKRFTLIEMLAVIAIVSILIATLAPAFNRMLFANKVDQSASGLKLGLELAQARAVSTRKYVAVILPTDRTAATSRKLRSFCNGGYRLAYVKKNDIANHADWKFDSWVENLSWRNQPDGAMLVDCATSAQDETTSINPKSGNCMTDIASSAAYNEDEDLVGIGAKASNASGDDSTSDNLRGIVFSPFGGLANQHQPFYLMITEAKYADGSYTYENRHNFILLKVNAVTGRVTYQE